MSLDPLGRMVLTGTSSLLELTSQPALRLIAHLVLCPEISKREQIADRLWPTSTNPGGSLRGALGKLRESLGDTADEVVRGDRYEIVLVDREHFASDVLELLSLDGVEEDTRSLSELLALTPNQLFAGLNDPWVAVAREQYLERIVALLRHAAACLEADGDGDGALRALKRWARLAPYSNDAQLALVTAMRGQRDIAGAISQYNVFRMKLQREHGVAPNRALLELYQELLEEDGYDESGGRVSLATPPWARPHTGWVIWPPPGVDGAADDAMYQSYAARFLTMDFKEIVRELPALERGIREDALYAFTQKLIRLASDVKGDVAWIGGAVVRVCIVAPAHEPELLVRLESLTGAEKHTMIARDIAQFGAIRVVKAEVPVSLATHGEAFVDDLVDHFRGAYVALEAAYVAAYRRWVAATYDLLYEVVNVQLRINDAEHVVGRYWFSVTDLPATTFRYHVDPAGVHAAIEHLKGYRTSTLPVWLAVTSLILDEVPDGVFGAENSCRIVHVEGDTTVMRFDAPVTLLRFENSPSLGINTQFWLSERVLYASDEIAAIDIATADDLTLQANCPVEHASPLAVAIEAVRDDLQLAFLNSLSALTTQRAELTQLVAAHHVNHEHRHGPAASG
ncbi:MAG TPA: bacterial transcriptional activator domain-containing protein [Baekduia sp.]|nr:bacterial transcriptional activator domain-containing protein [Baekduia sp.]